ncbi:hypothetical protein NA57DRAFT_75140 [Rhizodiscina lignyota]|uniref:Uncharacterized protein n=1 Tax=Rhizodiscina lignyota TaxID=1504668 RepID=A0A9P4IHY6_9PEZI|nr:hypothetical protein NA57DRAFT_75140 [Rhizodiscina lignyota]
MSIARAFTLRHKRTKTPPSAPAPDVPSANLGRADTLRRMGSVIDRNKISGPIELISTTNMLSYNAPDVAALRKMRQASSSSSISSSSGNDSDSSSPARSSAELTDASSVDDSSPTTPENHLSCYFRAAQDDAQKQPRRAASTTQLHRKTLSDTLAPAIPQRALSHSKSAHLQLARKRSVQTMSTLSSHSSSPSMGSLDRSSSIREQARASIDFFKGVVEPDHPFGKELEKLTEVVEEFGGAMRDAEMNEDVVLMKEKGLLKWTADDYLSELQPLYLEFGNNHPIAVTPTWI